MQTRGFIGEIAAWRQSGSWRVRTPPPQPAVAAADGGADDALVIVTAAACSQRRWRVKADAGTHWQSATIMSTRRRASLLSHSQCRTADRTIHARSRQRRHQV